MSASRKDKMPILTMNATVSADPETTTVLLDAMFCATKVYNGLLYAIKQAIETTLQSRSIRHSGD